MKRSLALLAIPLAALSFAACGDDDDDDSGTTPTSASGDTEPDTTEPGTTESDGTVPGGDTLPGGITLPSLPDITVPDISVPDISVPDMSEILGQAFPNLDEEQVNCLADRLGDVGTDFDPSQVLDVLGDCNIDPSEILPGG